METDCARLGEERKPSFCQDRFIRSAGRVLRRGDGPGLDGFASGSESEAAFTWHPLIPGGRPDTILCQSEEQRNIIRDYLSHPLGSHNRLKTRSLSRPLWASMEFSGSSSISFSQPSPNAST